MFTKKGQGISINVIIIAAIALLVLVILAVLLLRSANNLDTDCSEVGGECADNCGDLDGIYAPYKGTCLDNTEICCVPIKKNE